MESFFLNLGLSYTWSKALPYFILIALGIILGVMLFKRSKSLGMKIASLVAIVIPFIVYFAINPIYQGDFSNDSRIIEPSEELSEFSGNKLVVISLPGCIFCKQSVEHLREVKKRNKNIQIEYVVASSDSSTLTFYAEVIKGDFPLILAKHPEAMGTAAEGRFPSFVLVNGDQPIQAWNNNNFGVKALDEVVNSFK